MYDGNSCIDILKDLCIWISLICPNGDVDYVDYVQIKIIIRAHSTIVTDSPPPVVTCNIKDVNVINRSF